MIPLQSFVAVLVLMLSLARHAEAVPLKVGLILPLSGGIAPMGEAVRKGILLYEEEMERAHTERGVEFVIEDHQYDGKRALSAFHKLREHDKVDLVVVVGNTPSGVVAPVAERVSMPLFAVSFNPDAKDRKHVITFGPKTEQLVHQVAVQFTEWQSKRPAAVSVDLGNALLGVDMLRTELNGALEIVKIANDETEFKSIITRLKAKGIDTILLFALPEQALTFLRQTKDLDYRPNMIGGDVFADQTFLEKAKAAGSDIYFVYGAVQDDFQRRITERFGDSSFFFETATGYTTALMLERLSKSRTTVEENLITLFRKIDLSNLPVSDLKLVEDAEYGLHFVAGCRVYSSK